MQKFEVVFATDEGMDVLYLDDNNIVPALSVRGFEFDGFVKSKVLRAELQNQPKFTGLCGPMWGGMQDGQPVVRYETPEAYDILSD